MRFILGVAAGAAGGFAFARFIEASAAGVPLDMAFKMSNILTPVYKLSIRQQEERARLLQAAKGQLDGGNRIGALLTGYND